VVTPNSFMLGDGHAKSSIDNVVFADDEELLLELELVVELDPVEVEDEEV